MKAIVENMRRENEYVIDDGTKVVPIKNKHGEIIAEVRFRVTDINIIERAQNAQKNIAETLGELKNVSISPDGTANDEESMDILRRAKENISEQINSIFGADVCTQLFKACNPFSPIGRRFFVDSVVEVLVKIIDDEITQQQEELVDEYTSDPV